ncbi:MAG: LPS export ABC transporter periplasmic protein LptC [Acidobacteriota bacterium]
MLRSKSVRLTLIVLLAGGALIIAFNYVSRWSPPSKGKHADLLTPQQSRSLTNAVYQERKSGRLTFEIRADWSSETARNEIILRNVALTRFDEQGRPTNLVSGKEALYDQDGKQIRISRDVHLRLADGTDVYSNSISADLKNEVVNISEKFRFQRGDASGSGQALEYRIEPKEVEITGQFQLALPLDEGSAEIRAVRAVHNLNTHVIDLVGAASIEGAGNRLSSDRIRVEMTEQHKVRTVSGRGQGRLEIGPGRAFTGRQIDMLFDPAAGSLTRLEVAGAAGSPDRAVYQEQTPGGENYLEASRIVAVPQKEGKNTVLKDFRADERVMFRSQPLRITESRAEQLVGYMAARGKDLERIHLSGQVSALRQWEDKPATGPISERLTSEELDLRFRPGRMLDQGLALRNVMLRQTSARLDRSLSARESVRVIYREGQPDRLESRGDSQLAENDGVVRRTVTAPSIDVFYMAGRVSRVTAGPGVALTTEEKGIKRTSASQTAEAVYTAGQLAEVVQRGDVRIRDEQEKSKLELRAAVSRYEARNAALTLSGGTPLLRYWSGGDATGAGQETETTARRIELFRETDQIRAEGSVRTVLNQNGDLIVVESGRMEGDRKSGWAVYSDSPRITQKAGSVAGRVVRYNSQDQTVRVDEDVVSDLTDQKGKKYRVTSQHLVYDRQSGRARYEGQVEVTAADMNLKAPFVELIFEGEQKNQVSEVQAWGGVTVVQGERKARGPRAVYFPDTQKVVMTAEEATRR